MALSDAPKLAAGTKIQYEDPSNPGTYKDIPQVIKIPPMGNKGEFKETTPIDKVEAEYVAGRRKGEDLVIEGNDVPGNADQAEFLSLADASTTVNMRAITTTGRQGDFSLVLNGWKMNEPDGENQLTWSVFAMKTGTVTWSTAA